MSQHNLNEPYHRLEVLDPLTHVQEGELAVTLTGYSSQLLNEPQTQTPQPEAPQASLQSDNSAPNTPQSTSGGDQEPNA